MKSIYTDFRSFVVVHCYQNLDFQRSYYEFKDCLSKNGRVYFGTFTHNNASPPNYGLPDGSSVPLPFFATDRSDYPCLSDCSAAPFID